MNLLDHPVSTWGPMLSREKIPGWRARQIAHWVFRRQMNDTAAMSNLPESLRSTIQTRFSLSIPEVRSRHLASDGTLKLALTLHDGQVIESVLIPRKGRMTLCLSTQVGCGIGCRFCRTAEMGLVRNLAPSEIVGQWIVGTRVLNEEGASPMDGHPPIDHIVFMGMGEPLANLDSVISAIRTLTDPDGAGLSARRLTVSTSGLAPRIRALGEARLGVRLAVSLTAPDDGLRQEIMPVGRVYPIKEILDACRSYPLKPRERITFEYVLLKGVNDSPDQASALGRLLAPFKSKVNLIPFNPYEGSPYARPSDDAIEAFGAILSRYHVTATVRRTMGKDIRAACGQLAWSETLPNDSTNGEPLPWTQPVRSF